MRCVTVSSFYAIIISLLIFKSNYLLHFWVTPKTQLQPHNKHHHFCLSECACFKAKFIFFTPFFFFYSLCMNISSQLVDSSILLQKLVAFGILLLIISRKLIISTCIQEQSEGERDKIVQKKKQACFFFLEVMGLGWSYKRRTTKWNDISYGRREGKEP